MDKTHGNKELSGKKPARAGLDAEEARAKDKPAQEPAQMPRGKSAWKAPGAVQQKASEKGEPSPRGAIRMCPFGMCPD